MSEVLAEAILDLPDEQRVEDEDPPTLQLQSQQKLHEAAAFETARARLFAGEGEVLVSRYRILRQVGRGGFGSVFEAHDPELDRAVAIKLLHASLGVEGPSAESLHREAKLLARFRHPNVVSVYDVGRYDREESRELREMYPHVAPAGVFLVMELVEGLTLSQWLRTQRGWREILEVFQMAGRALADAHAHGIVHRDFKPGNVMVESDGNVRVGDFGLSEGIADATPSERDLRQSSPGVSASSSPGPRNVFGTTVFMAPELFTDAPLDERVDQYAFGVSLYLALAGELPPRAGSPSEAPAKDSLVRKFRGRGPRPVWRAIARMLAFDPSSRFATMSDALAAIDVRRVQRRRRVAALAIGVGGVLGLASIVREQPSTVDCYLEASAADALWSERLPSVDAAFELGIAAGRVDPSERDLARVHIGRFLDDWRWARRTSCLASEVRQRSEEVIEAACLDDLLADFSGMTSGLVLSDGMITPRAADIVAELPSCAQCIGPDAVGLQVNDSASSAERSAMRTELARYDVLLAEDPRQVMAAVEQLAPRLSQLPSLQPKADHLAADATWLMGDLEAAIERYVDVYLLATRNGLHADALGAAAVLSSYLTASLQRPGEGRIWAQLAYEAFDAAGAPAHEAATIEELQAVVAQGDGRSADAVMHLERTLLLELARPPLARERALHLLDAMAQNAQSYDVAGALSFATAARKHAHTAWPRRVPLHVSIDSNYVDALRRAGFDRTASDAAHALLPEMDELVGSTHPMAAKIRMQLALAERDAGRSELAATLVTEATAAFELAVGPASPLTRRAAAFGWLLLVDQGRAVEAERLVTAALEDALGLIGGDGELIAEFYEVRAAARYAQGDLDGANFAGERALALSNSPRSRAKLLHTIAAWALLADDFVRARALLERVDLAAVAGSDLATARDSVLWNALPRSSPRRLPERDETSALTSAWELLEGMDVRFAALAQLELARRSSGRQRAEWLARCESGDPTLGADIVRVVRDRCRALREDGRSTDKRQSVTGK